MKRRYIGLGVCLAAAAMFALAQETTLKVDVNVVNLFFSVRDKKGALIPSLTKDDFAVLEDSKQQTIKYFSRESDLPLTLGLLVDVSKSQESLIEIEKQTAADFFAQVLRPKDMAFLISFGAETELLQDLTNSQRLLKAGLQGLRLSVQPMGIHPGPAPTASRQKGTLLYDAVYLAATEKLRGEVGRKAIVLITDGADFGSHYKLRDAIDAAHRADAIIYSIYYVDPHYRGFGYPSDSDLKKMSEETGGQVFHVGRKNTLKEIFTRIQEEMRSQYVLGYTPTNNAADGSFRKVEIRANQKDLKVHARKGYFAPAQ